MLKKLSSLRRHLSTSALVGLQN